MTDSAQPPENLVAFIPPAALFERMGIEVVDANVDRVVATMPVEGNTQPYGLLHGGASVVLAESVASIASALHAGPDRISVGVDINATHHRGVRSGRVTGTATPIHLGSTMTTHAITITDDEDRVVCTARLTSLLRDATR